MKCPHNSIMRAALQKKKRERERKKNETKMSGDKERESVANISRI